MTVHTDTSRSDDLVKRLRGFYCGDMGEPADPINPDGPEAADRIEELTSMEECLTAELGDANDRIEALEAENERLREALENIVNNCGQCSGYGTYPAEDTATGKVLWWDCSSPQCHSARVALGDTK